MVDVKVLFCNPAVVAVGVANPVLLLCSRQLALLDHMAIDEDGKLYHTHWPQGKTATKGISLQWVVPKLWRVQLLELHHDTPVDGHLGRDMPNGDFVLSTQKWYF